MHLAILICAFAVLFSGIVLVAALVARKMVEKLIVERHEALKEIVETGAVPKSWSERYERKVARLGCQSGTAEMIAEIHAQAAHGHLRRLDRLRRYVEVSSAVDSEETRHILLNRLAEVRSTWRPRIP